MTEKLKACPRDAAIHAVALIEMGREGAPYSRDQEEFYSDAAEVVDAVLAAVTPAPAADEVEAVAWAIIRAANEEDAVRELQEYGNAGPFARAAIAALQVRSAEPAGDVEAAFLRLCEEIGIPATAGAYLEYRSRKAEPAGMMDAAWEAYQNTGIDLCADSDDETRKCVENAVRAALKAAEPAGEEPVAWQRKHPDRGWINAYQNDLPFYRAKGQEVRGLYAHPATPTNPERLVRERRLFSAAFEAGAQAATPEGEASMTEIDTDKLRALDEGPQLQRIQFTCEGCKHLTTEDWEEYPDGERDSGTSAWCNAGDKRNLSAYWSPSHQPPSTCPFPTPAILAMAEYNQLLGEVLGAITGFADAASHNNDCADCAKIADIAFGREKA